MFQLVLLDTIQMRIGKFVIIVMVAVRPAMTNSLKIVQPAPILGLSIIGIKICVCKLVQEVIMKIFPPTNASYVMLHCIAKLVL